MVSSFTGCGKKTVWTVVLYDRSSDVEKISEARKLLFSQKGKPIDALPPKLAALLKHTK